MYNGIIPYDERYFCALYELDDDDDYEDMEVWAKANPLFVQFPEIMKKMESDYKSAKTDPEKLQLFRTKNLNQWLSGDVLVHYLDYDSWLSCQTKEVDLEGKEVYIGVDMSKSTDLSAVSIMAKDDDGTLLLKTKAFIPKEVINQKEITDKMPYSSYVNGGYDYLTATEGKFVNQQVIEEYIRGIEDKYRCSIRAICFDSWQSLHLMSSLSQDYEVVDVKMTYRNLSPAIKRFRERVYDDGVRHQYNPILNFCVGNAITKMDLQENILLDKKRSANRIDLIVSSIIAYSEIMEEETSEEYGDYFVI